MAKADLLKQVKEKLSLEQLQATGRGGGGCISQGQAFLTENGKVFVKFNSKPGASLMFEGEYASLKAISDTNTIRVPKPLCVATELNGSAALAMEYLDLKSGSGGAALGDHLADLHLHNSSLKCTGSRVGEASHFESRFGFQVPTCCGYIEQQNEWSCDWIHSNIFQSFYAAKLDFQIKKLESEGRDGKEASELWHVVQRVMPSLFEDIEGPIVPALLHGDLWGGNAALTTDEGGRTVPVVFDAASFYGHHEYDLAIAGMFGGFNASFWSAYFKKIPKQKDWDRRNELYELFHYLNHWNHFGSGYAGQSLSLLKSLSKIQ